LSNAKPKKGSCTGSSPRATASAWVSTSAKRSVSTRSAKWDTGFEIVYLRKPKLDDFIVPAFPALTKAISRSGAYKAIVADCARADVTCRGMHATRHTFISAVQRGGADPKVVERITHNASGSMIDHYTHREWDELCAAMLCLAPYILVAALDSKNAAAENMLESCSDSRTRTLDPAVNSRLLYQLS